MNKRVLILLAATLGCSGAASVIVNSGERVMENREEKNRGTSDFDEQNLINAVIDGDLEEVKRNIIAGNIDPNIEDDKGIPLIVKAIKLGKNEIADILADKFVRGKIYTEDHDPFIQAVINGDTKLASKLLGKYGEYQNYFYIEEIKDKKHILKSEKSFISFVLKGDATDRAALLRELSRESSISSILAIDKDASFASVAYTSRYEKIIDDLSNIYSGIVSKPNTLTDKHSEMKEKIRHAIEIINKFSNNLEYAKYPSQFSEGKSLIFFLMLVKDDSNVKHLASKIYKEKEHKELHGQILKELMAIFPEIGAYWQNRDLNNIYYLIANHRQDENGYSLTNIALSTTPPSVKLERHPSIINLQKRNSLLIDGDYKSLLPKNVSDTKSEANVSNAKKGILAKIKQKVFGSNTKSKEAEDTSGMINSLGRARSASFTDVSTLNTPDASIISQKASPAASPMASPKTPRKGNTFRPTSHFQMDKIVDMDKLIELISDNLDEHSIAMNKQQLEQSSKQLINLMVKGQIFIKELEFYLKNNVYDMDLKKDILKKLISKANMLSSSISDYDGDKNKCKELATQLRKLIKQFK